MTALLRHLVNLVLFGFPPTRLFAFRRLLWKCAGLELGSAVAISGGGWIYGVGAIAIGDETWLSPGVRIYSNPKAPIAIGPRCDIGHDVRFVTGSHELAGPERRAGHGTAHPVKVGAGCWIGAGSTILGGVEIGSGTVIAAGSVVVGDIPANVLAAGVPAKVKRHLEAS